MKIACVYINAGKGHFIPAKSIADAMVEKGLEIELVDFFDIIKDYGLDMLNQKIWQIQLKHPKLEIFINGTTDKNGRTMNLLVPFFIKRYKKDFLQWLELHKPDAFISTHYFPSRLIPEILDDCGLEIPSFAYASDVFFTPTSGLTNKLRKFYISTLEGQQHVLAKQLVPEKVELTTFPIQTGCVSAARVSKAQAREKLSLQNKFTLVINLGGEGIGTTRLIKKLDKLELEMQVMVLGGMDEKSRELFRVIGAQLKYVNLTIAGFVSNVYDYVLASDVVAGKAGINTMVEAAYFKRPFLITGLYYTVLAAADFYERHKIGWLALDVDSQVDIIARCMREPDILLQMEDNFKIVPITYGASAIADSIIKEVMSISGGSISRVLS